MEISEELKKTDNVYMSSDKGNNQGLGHFVKILSWWDDVLEPVRQFTLDIDASEGCSSDCADAIVHSLKKLDRAITSLLSGLHY